MAKIVALAKEGKKQGFKIGDELVSFDGYPFCDILDCLFYDSKEKFSVVVKRNGKEKTIKVKKKADVPLGIEIDKELSPVRCKNKCKFCFVDQLPKGMRDALYVKDDDYRFSFISGSYVTMTNVTEKDIERILRLKLSPLYISVHAMNDEIRKDLVRNPNTLKLRQILKTLSDGGIKMHTQLVVVPDVNDGDVMLDSIDRLHEIEGVLSVAIVPVGLTTHRSGLDNLKPFDKEEAAKTIDLVEERYNRYGGFCFAADEMYIKAEREIPSYEFYQDFPQIENGVGLVREFLESVEYSLDETPDMKVGKRVCMLTGVSFEPVLKNVAKIVADKLGLEITVKAIENNFFGKTVTVSGLVTAGDILAQAPKGYDAYTVPSNMLKEFSTLFLDNVSLDEVEKALGKVIVVNETGGDLIKKLSELK
ncbi:MAG: DUF512 domain-containing protein [Acidaminococcus sp.]|nr:DUF512 domain-containing protein [Acidaminococcus sp.]MDD7398244.1 DUF512 domain-containing protein [Bacillota bacterium]